MYAEENNGLDAEKINAINERAKEYVASELGDEYTFNIVYYGESGTGCRSEKSLFQPPECVHMSDLFDYTEYGMYSQNSYTHSYNIYRDYVYIGCGCSGTLKMTNNPSEPHQFYYVDKGHSGDTHSYDYRCKICNYLKYTRYYDCPGLKTGQHVTP